MLVEKPHSEATAQPIDEEVLTWCREQVDKVGRPLLETEVLEEADVVGLLGPGPLRRRPPMRSLWKARAACRRTCPFLRGGRRGLQSATCRRAQLGELLPKSLENKLKHDNSKRVF